jgi:hypothetical protein
MNFDSEYVSIVIVFWKFYSNYDIHLPPPANTLLPHDIQVLYDLALLWILAHGVIEIVAASVLCSNY